MNKESNIHFYDNTPFSIITTEIPNGKGKWSYYKVEIFNDFVKIGEYTRMYNFGVIETFYPFQLDNVWYALYSDIYTTTKIAKLTNTFEFLCGEEGRENGFCPVEFYVPKFYFYENDISSPYLYHHFKPYKSEYTRYGFLSGCVWGDDSSWKLRYIDLSDIHNKNFKIEQKFGYLELVDKPLKECIYIDEYDSSIIEIECKKRFEL